MRGNPACEQEQEFEAGRVAPVQVFENHDQGLMFRQLEDRLRKGLEDAPFLSFGVRARHAERRQIGQGTGQFRE